MSIESNPPARQSRERVSLHDPLVYELTVEGKSRRDIFGEFVEQFPRYVAERAQAGDIVAQELRAALNSMDEDRIANIVALTVDVDWVDESPITDTHTLFGIMQHLHSVLNHPNPEYAMIDSYRLEHGEAELTVYTRWLFKDLSLTVRHGYLWEQFIENEFANHYVKKREKETPSEVTDMLRRAQELGADADVWVWLGEDSRKLGVTQLVRTLVGSLEKCEEDDARFNFAIRQRVARELSFCDDEEAMLYVLRHYIEPEGIDPDQIHGAVIKPVLIQDSEGRALHKAWQRSDSLWFNPIAQHGDCSDDSGFPDNPQMIDRYFGFDEDHPTRRAILYRDVSYFRPDGTKIYWGDLSNQDVANIKGSYYCLSQADSYHDVPDWAKVVGDPTNFDPNRPVSSMLEGEHAHVGVHDNPIMLHPDYLRAVAIGAIINGAYIDNDDKRMGRIHCRPKVLE